MGHEVICLSASTVVQYDVEIITRDYDQELKKVNETKNTNTASISIIFSSSHNCRSFNPYFEWDATPTPPPKQNESGDAHFESLSELQGKSTLEIAELVKENGGRVRVLGFRRYEEASGTEFLFPFPNDQYVRAPASPNHVPCANEYYEAPKAIDINGNWMNQPNPVCGWGSIDFMLGVIVAPPKDVADWLEAYGARG